MVEGDGISNQGRLQRSVGHRGFESHTRPKFMEKSEGSGKHLANGNPKHRESGGRNVELEPDIGGRWHRRVEAI